jgi:cytochrome b6-f complex iron-sulfur subunit
MSTSWERRRFLSTAVATAAAFVATGCSRSKGTRRAAITGNGAFGGRVDAGPIDELRSYLASNTKPFYVPEARAYIIEFPADKAQGAIGAYPKDALPMLEAGLIVLYQRCTHLGCRVPWCLTSEWFECPCHGAKFDRIGEMRAGPAPRGMDLIPSSIEDGHLVDDTGKILRGASIGTNTTNQKPSGPFCVGRAGQAVDTGLPVTRSPRD